VVVGRGGSRMKPIRVYITGPYTKGDVAQNVHAAIQAGDRLAQAGLFPFIPHLTHFWHLLYSHDWKFWLAQDFVWLEACDVLLRLPGESNGADLEVQRARELGMTVYWSVEAILKVL